MTGPLNGHSQLPLMTGTGTSHSAGNDFRPLRQISSQSGNVLVSDVFHLIHAESANLSAAFSVAIRPFASLRPLASLVSFHSTKPPL